ncbi:hypothetical protein BOX15_Mlig005373g1 [Macrostomum lignano]|uniref:YTH domain-containing protein n=1 Tax=Macrostomum lignano TaxID=282301 RepID=A0A267E4S5_9PLAT|nr:hypothetical protein BOX15_Mlig005373g1 [Macrostomum lignano]
MSATEVEQQQQQEQPADESTAAEQFSKPAISPIRMQSADVNNENVAAETVAAASEQQQQPVFVGDSAAAAGSPPPEQPEQLDHLFRDARYFMIKSSNYENVSLAKAKGVWATPPPNEHRLNGAYHESRSVYLIFSVKESGRFQVVI